MSDPYRWFLSMLALVVPTAIGFAGSQDTAGVQMQVDHIFKAFTQATPGCAVGVDVKGEPVVRALYGMADLEHDVPFTVDTIFVARVSRQTVHGGSGAAASARR